MGLFLTNRPTHPPTNDWCINTFRSFLHPWLHIIRPHKFIWNFPPTHQLCQQKYIYERKRWPFSSPFADVIYEWSQRIQPKAHLDFSVETFTVVCDVVEGADFELRVSFFSAAQIDFVANNDVRRIKVKFGFILYYSSSFKICTQIITR